MNNPNRFACALAIAVACLATSAEAQLDPLYISSDLGHEVLRYDPTTGVFIDTFIPLANNGGLNQPHGILDRGTDILVASFGTDSILRYDRDTGAPLGTFISAATGLNDPVYILVGPDGNLYVSSQASEEILRYAQDGTFIDAFVTAGSGGLDGPSGLVFHPNGRLYVGGRFSANVIAYDAATGAFLEVIADSTDGLASGNTFGLALGDNSDLYFASNNTVFRYDPDTSAIIATVPFGFPIGLESGPGGDIYVATANNLSIIDTGDDTVSGPFLAGGAINLLNFFHFSGSACAACPGDMNLSGAVDVDDIAPFVARLLTAEGLRCADVNGDGVEDGRDVAAFVDHLLQGDCVE